MPIFFACPSCHQRFSAPDDATGKLADCSACGASFQIRRPTLLPPRTTKNPRSTQVPARSPVRVTSRAAQRKPPALRHPTVIAILGAALTAFVLTALVATWNLISPPTKSDSRIPRTRTRPSQSQPTVREPVMTGVMEALSSGTSQGPTEFDPNDAIASAWWLIRTPKQLAKKHVCGKKVTWTGKIGVLGDDLSVVFGRGYGVRVPVQLMGQKTDPIRATDVNYQYPILLPLRQLTDHRSFHPSMLAAPKYVRVQVEATIETIGYTMNGRFGGFGWASKDNPANNMFILRNAHLKSVYIVVPSRDRSSPLVDLSKIEQYPFQWGVPSAASFIGGRRNPPSNLKNSRLAPFADIQWHDSLLTVLKKIRSISDDLAIVLLSDSSIARKKKEINIRGSLLPAPAYDFPFRFPITTEIQSPSDVQELVHAIFQQTLIPNRPWRLGFIDRPFVLQDFGLTASPIRLFGSTYVLNVDLKCHPGLILDSPDWCRQQGSQILGREDLYLPIYISQITLTPLFLTSSPLEKQAFADDVQRIVESIKSKYPTISLSGDASPLFGETRQTYWEWNDSGRTIRVQRGTSNGPRIAYMSGREPQLENLLVTHAKAHRDHTHQQNEQQRLNNLPRIDVSTGL